MFCDKCQAFWHEALSIAEISDPVKSCEDVRWKYYETVLHSNIGGLKRASDLRCRLCRIIYSTPTDYEHQTLLKDHNEALNIVLNIDPSKGPHPVLSAEFREASRSQPRISKRMVASCSGLINDEDLVSTLRAGSELDNSHTGSDGAFELAAFWTKSCIANHEKCRPPATQHQISFVPTRLLDVSNDAIRLIESKHDIDKDSDRRFVALSHCWGLRPLIRTLVANYDDHRNGIAPEKLSKTFREAIYATRKLGFRYIWIDSLCIKQDDGDDWAREAATMCDVYQYAALTISAAHASGGHIGCFAERDGLLQLPFFIGLPQTPDSGTPTRILFTSYGRVKDLGGGDPALFGRAWVLQEELLSPRLLLFDGAQIKWECLTMHGSESSPTSGTTRNSLYHKFVRSGIMDEYEYFDHVDAEGFTDSRLWSLLKHQYWCYLIMDYTHRGMTKSTDRLVALAGVGKALSRHTKSQYLAGLWSEHFITGLLWHIAHNEKFAMSAAEGFDIERNEKIRHEQHLAPSWSWASVTGPVMYASNELLSYDRICSIINISVSDSVATQTGRIELRGHIRRGYVNAVYPHSIREAAKQYPHMTTVKPSGMLGTEETNFKNRLFHPNDWFLFSETPPITGTSDTSTDALTRKGSFRLVHGSFKPDQLIDPAQQLTFLAVAQQHFGAQLTTRLASHKDDDALKVHSLALLPTGVEGEYTRVGLAIWDECAWYGYLCGWKDARDRIVEKPGRWTGDGGRWVKEGWLDRVGRRLWWDDLEMYEETKEGGHGHGYVKDCLPEWGTYHGEVKVEERSIVII